MAYGETQHPENHPWAHCIIAMAQSDDFDPAPRPYLALQARIIKAIKRWLVQLHLPEQFLWVREHAGYGFHSHILLRLPPEHRLALADLIRHVGRLHDTSNNKAVVIKPEWDRQASKLDRKPDTKGMYTHAQRCGVLLDLCKTMDPNAMRDGKRIMEAMGIRHRAACTIEGKRSGTSVNLNRAARAAAGWKELTTPAELHAALGGVIAAAKKAHDRRKKQRKRARRGATTVPLLRPQASTYVFTDDLVADFLD
ncbi:MAG: hypothetical protein EOP50_00925 [Sphingobacteriales bacterium]|nr:MAG: hypothetical protein EOP50_00925 [Sphingobacteriales bacterium]